MSNIYQKFAKELEIDINKINKEDEPLLSIVPISAEPDRFQKLAPKETELIKKQLETLKSSFIFVPNTPDYQLVKLLICCFNTMIKKEEKIEVVFTSAGLGMKGARTCDYKLLDKMLQEYAKYAEKTQNNLTPEQLKKLCKQQAEAHRGTISGVCRKIGELNKKLENIQIQYYGFQEFTQDVLDLAAKKSRLTATKTRQKLIDAKEALLNISDPDVKKLKEIIRGKPLYEKFEEIH